MNFESIPMRKLAFIHSAELEKFSYPADCPFESARAGQARKTICNMGLLSGNHRREMPPVKADRKTLEMFHTPDYLDALMAAGKGELGPAGFQMGLGTPDCPVFKGMYDYAALAAGASVTGARLLLAHEVDIAFNPSGGYHHAMPGRARGFCYINDIVLAAMTLADARKRVLFLDVDVHHCDGVQHAFYKRKDVMTISMHENGRSLFPGTGWEDEIGEGPGKGYTVNIPLPVGTYDAAYEHAFREAALPLMKAYNPDVIIMEIGMDALAGDPLAHLHLTNNTYADIVAEVVALGKPILATGGGGYHVENTVRGWALVWSVFCGEHENEMALGMGGVMLENTDWPAGLRDRVLLSDAGQRRTVDQDIEATIQKLKTTLFPIHGL
ncbi:MAG: acetoin utilization protein AcuC [Planctomycetota bacterium]